MNKIKWILNKIYSKRDRAGNCYWAFNLTDAETGKTVNGRISGGESNLNSMIYYLNNEDWGGNYYSTTQEKPIREFNHLVKEFPYVGCSPQELAKFVKNELTKPDK